MSDSTTTLKILMQVKADVADLTGKLTPALKEVQTQAAATAAAINQTTSNPFGINQTQTGGLAQLAAAQAENAAAAERSAKWAAVQAREIANSVGAATQLSSITNGLGNTFFFAGAAALGIYKVLTSITDEMVANARHSLDFQNNLFKAETEFSRMAREARTFGDEIKLADKMKAQIDKMEADLDAFREREKLSWQSVGNAIASFFELGIKGAGSGLQPFTDPKTTETAKREKEAADALSRNADRLKENIRSVKEWNLLQQDLPKGLEIENEKLSEAQVKLAALTEAFLAKPTQANFDAYQAQVHVVEGLTDKTKQLRTELEQKNKQEENAAAKAAREAELNIRKQINDYLRETNALLASIRGQEQIVQQNPFASVDQKNAQSIPLIKSEIAALNAEIAKGKALIAGGGLDPAQYERVDAEVKKAERDVTLLTQKVQTLSFAGGFKAELTNWVNSFGTSAHQVASIITGTLNTAIASTSQAITGLIFKTGNWKQAFYQAAQSIVQNIVQIALQWATSQLFGNALSAASRAVNVAGATAAGSATAAAWATPAAFVSVATEGAADIAGTTGLAAAVASALSLALSGSVGAAEGWYVDRGSHSTADDVPVRVSRGEGIINAREVARRGGRAWVDSINTGVSRAAYVSGGFIGGGGSSSGSGSGAGGKTEIHVFNFTNIKDLQNAVLNSRAGQKIIVDTINGNRVNLGLR